MTQSKPHPAEKMTKSEFSRLAQSVWGPFWKKPASRFLCRDPKMMRLYASGTFPVPREVAEKLRQLADIGLAGKMVKAIIFPLVTDLKGHAAGAVKKTSHERAHRAAIEIVEQLDRAGFLKRNGE